MWNFTVTAPSPFSCGSCGIYSPCLRNVERNNTRVIAYTCCFSTFLNRDALCAAKLNVALITTRHRVDDITYTRPIRRTASRVSAQRNSRRTGEQLQSGTWHRRSRATRPEDGLIRKPFQSFHASTSLLRPRRGRTDPLPVCQPTAAELVPDS